jgi:hypothetical protein
MKMTKIFSIAFNDLQSRQVDGVFVASGYESRARAFAQQIRTLSNFKKVSKYAWGFKEYQDDPVRMKNDASLERMGYGMSIISSSDSDLPEKTLSDIILESSRPLSLVVDISSMTRTWYGGIIKALSRAKHNFPIDIIFAYTPAVWSKNVEPIPPNEVVGPVSGYSSHVLPNKPTALIIGLGREDERAIGLIEYLDPKTTVCFYASPGSDVRYEDEVVGANDILFPPISPEKNYPYDLFDTFGTYKMLESVCQGLVRDYRVVLVSLGPKIFGLLCFMINISLPEISVWRVSPATRQTPIDHKPEKKKILLDVQWEQ